MAIAVNLTAVPDITCVELPFHVSAAASAPGSVPTEALETLGGVAAVGRATASEAPTLELHFRPQDALCHPVVGDLVKTTNMLVRIKRRKRDGAVATGDSSNGGSGSADAARAHAAEAPSAASAEVMGVVRSTYRFRGLADFQHVSQDCAFRNMSEGSDSGGGGGGSRLGRKRTRSDNGGPVLDLAAIKARTALELAPPLFTGFDLPQLAAPTMALESAAARYAAVAAEKAPRSGAGAGEGAGGAGSRGGGSGNNISARVVDFKVLLREGPTALPAAPAGHVPIDVPSGVGTNRPDDDVAAASSKGTAAERLRRLFALRPIWTIEALQLRLRKDAAAARRTKEREAADAAAKAAEYEGVEGGGAAVAAADMTARLAADSTASYLVLSANHLKQALPSIAYKFKNGPWRTAWVRYGYVPSLQPAARKFQVIDLRNQDSLKEGVPDSAIAEDVTLHGYPVRKKMTLQWCDLRERDVLFAIDEVPASGCCTEKEGWLFKDVLVLLKQLARKATDTVLLQAQLARSNCNEDNIQKQEEEITQSKLAVSRARVRML